MHKYMGLLESELASISLEATEEQKRALLAYADEIEKWNKRMNLVRSTGEGIIQQHIIDSLAATSYFALYTHVADLGSGAGLPGIPLAIMTPETKWSLVERGAQRAAFLSNAVGLLSLAPRTQVCLQDAKVMVSGIEALTCRAFLPLSVVLELIEPYLVQGVHLFAYQGKPEETEAELKLYAKQCDKRGVNMPLRLKQLPLATCTDKQQRWIWEVSHE